MSDQKRPVVIIGHVDHGRTSLTAALVRVLAHGVKVESGATKSWYCHSCAVKVYQLRCPHCGKTKRERT